jgi:hypothetical protein
MIQGIFGICFYIRCYANLVEAFAIGEVIIGSGYGNVPPVSYPAAWNVTSFPVVRLSLAGVLSVSSGFFTVQGIMRKRQLTGVVIKSENHFYIVLGFFCSLQHIFFKVFQSLVLTWSFENIRVLVCCRASVARGL